jgi:hypothetical protein
MYCGSTAELRGQIRAAWRLSVCVVWGEMKRRVWSLSRNKRLVKWWLKSPRINPGWKARNWKRTQSTRLFVSWSLMVILRGSGPTCQQKIKMRKGGVGLLLFAWWLNTDAWPWDGFGHSAMICVRAGLPFAGQCPARFLVFFLLLLFLFRFVF